MEYRNKGAITGIKAFQRLRRQGNFWNHDDGPFSVCQSLINELDIDAGLPASGHSIEERSPPGPEAGEELLIGLLLLLREHDGRRVGLLVFFIRPAIRFLFVRNDNIFPEQGLYDCFRITCEIAEFFYRERPLGKQDQSHVPLLFGKLFREFLQVFLSLDFVSKTDHAYSGVPHIAGSPLPFIQDTLFHHPFRKIRVGWKLQCGQ